MITKPFDTFALTESDLPIWTQIEQGVRRLISERVFRPGEAIPSVRQMARKLAVTPNTVARAYQQLIAAGVCVSRRGSGTYVADAFANLSSRDQLLHDAAGQFAQLASAVGAPLDEAAGELAAAYRRLQGSMVATF